MGSPREEVGWDPRGTGELWEEQEGEERIPWSRGESQAGPGRRRGADSV